MPSQTSRTPEQRVVEASVVVPDGGGITGWGALRWAGGVWFDGTDRRGRERPVTVATCYSDVRNQPGITICQERLSTSDLVVHDGLVLTSMVRSTCFEMRYAPSVVEAVVAADMSALSDLSSIAELGAYIAEHPGWTGIPQAREALSLMHENSWSPMETRLRVLWVVQAGLPPPLVNRPVFDLDGRHLGTPDLLDLEAGLAVEYDGADHLTRPQRLVDVRREDVFGRAGLDTATVVADEFHSRPRLVDRLQDARRRGLSYPRERRWTVEPPSWWRPLDTVEQRRADRERRASA